MALQHGYLSIGIDVGTTTWHWLVHRILLQRRPGRGGCPRFRMVAHERVFESSVRITPYGEKSTRIDHHRIGRDLETGLESMPGLRDDIETGSVIVTGQAARKENAGRLLTTLSGMFSNLVSTVAGTRLESVLAARGARIDRYSRKQLKTILNIDIGGGTSNLALYENGELSGTACLWLGARMIRFDGAGRVRAFTGEAEVIARRAGVVLAKGNGSRSDLNRIGADAVKILADFLDGGAVPAEFLDHRDLPRPLPKPDAVCFTGGVAELLRDLNRYRKASFPFNDLGVFMARNLVSMKPEWPRLEPAAARIRATALGAAIHHGQLAGATIHVTDPDSLPLRDLPVVPIRLPELADASGRSRVRRLEQLHSGARSLAYSVETGDPAGFSELQTLARFLLDGLKATGRDLVVVALDRDLGKIFGNIFESERGPGRPARIVSLDGVALDGCTSLDVGRYLGQGALPVSAKTLYF